jgi:hypothetical protein
LQRRLPTVTAAIFGLIGVIVGGVLNAVVAVVFDSRRAALALRTSARLVAEEIQSNGRTLYACVQTGLWLAMRNHPLRFSTWESNAETLARMPYRDWVTVAEAIRLTTQIDRIHGHREHTQLSPMDPPHVQDAVRACELAVGVLERHGRGSDETALPTAGGAAGRSAGESADDRAGDLEHDPDAE